MMRNSHGRGSANALKTRIKPLPDSTGGDACGHVNKDNKLQILWRFSAYPTPSYCNVEDNDAEKWG